MPPSCSSGRFYSPTLGMLFALLFIICAFTYAAIDIQSISQPATVSFRSIGTGLETLGLDGKQQPLQLELKTPQRAFLLDLERPKNLLSPDYEEVTHDITRGTVRNPHINVIRRGTNHHEVSNLNNCLYSGKIAGDPLSSVSLSTCSGHITGMIRLSTGELFSIEPTTDRNIASNSKTAPNLKTLTPSSYLQPLAALRTLARNGDLKTLADNIPTVNIVDVLAEARLEDEEEKKQKNVYPFNIKKRASTKADPLNVEDIDQGDVVSTTTKKCASDVQKNHPPLSVLRKIGFNSKDLRQFVRDHGLKSTTLSTLSGEDDTKDYTTQAETATALAYPTRYLEVVIYHDKARLNSYKKAGLSEDDIMAQARDDSIEVFNNIRAYYQGAGFQHAIEYILKGHVFFPKGDPYIKYLAGDGGTMVINNYGLLENFNKYRNLYGHSGHDIGILLSGNRFQSNIKGVANVGSLCGGARYNGNINSVTYRNIVLNSVLTAHECGHVMNAQHDSNPGYIMNPYVSSDTSFSPNSKRSIDWMLSRTTCTINNPQTSTALGGDVDDRDTNTTAYGVLSDTVNKLSGGRLGAPSSQRSSIYTSNIHNDDQIDFVNESLLTGGVFNSAEYSLSDDSNILINRQLRDITQQSSTTTTTTPIAPDTHVGSKGGFSLRDLLLTLGLSALAACALTTIAILGALRYVSHDKQLQHYISKPIEKLIPLHHTTAAKDSKHTTKTDNKKTSSIHHHTTPPTATRPISYQNAVTQNIPTNTTTTESSRYTFVPRTTNKPSAAAVGGLGLDTAVNTNANGLSPNTPREVPASPTYSESVRHRAHSAQTTDQTGIIFEGDHDGQHDGDESDEDLRSLH